jgi:hypothetical protein
MRFAQQINGTGEKAQLGRQTEHLKTMSTHRNAVFELSCVRLPTSVIASRLLAHASSSNRRPDSRLRLVGWPLADEVALNVLHRYALANYNHVEFMHVHFARDVALQLRIPSNVLSVEFSFLPAQTSDDIAAIVAAIARQSSVVDLAIGSGSVAWRAPDELVAAPALRELAIFSNVPLDVSVERAVLSLVQRSVVRFLRLDAFATPAHQLELAADLHALHTLALSLCVTSECVAALADTLCTNRTLRRLDLEYLALSAHAGARLVRMIERNVTLTSLSMSMTSFESSSSSSSAPHAHNDGVAEWMAKAVAERNGTLLQLWCGAIESNHLLLLRRALKRNEGIQWHKQRRKIARVLFALAARQLPSLVLLEVILNTHEDYWLLPYYFVMSTINAVSDAVHRKEERKNRIEQH